MSKRKVFNRKMLKKIGITFILSSTLISVSAMANECTQTIKANKVYDAVDICTKMAKDGDVQSQFALGTLYYQGQGVMVDKKQGFKWIKRAAEGGMPVAQYNVGILLANGLGVEANLEKAYTWMYVANKYGYTEAKDPMEKMAKELSKKEKSRAIEAAKVLLGENEKKTSAEKAPESSQ